MNIRLNEINLSKVLEPITTLIESYTKYKSQTKKKFTFSWHVPSLFKN